MSRKGESKVFWFAKSQVLFRNLRRFDIRLAEKQQKNTLSTEVHSLVSKHMSDVFPLLNNLWPFLRLRAINTDLGILINEAY